MERSPLFGLSQVMHVGILLLIELEFALTLRLLLSYLSNHPAGGEERGMYGSSNSIQKVFVCSLTSALRMLL